MEQVAQFDDTSGDYFKNARLQYELSNTGVKFDYDASSMGIKFYQPETVGRIELVPNDVISHRMKKENIRILYRENDDSTFTELFIDAMNGWRYVIDAKGKIILTLKVPVSAKEIKIHSTHDDRDIVTGNTVDRAQFKGAYTRFAGHIECLI